MHKPFRPYLFRRDSQITSRLTNKAIYSAWTETKSENFVVFKFVVTYEHRVGGYAVRFSIYTQCLSTQIKVNNSHNMVRFRLSQCHVVVFYATRGTLKVWGNPWERFLRLGNSLTGRRYGQRRPGGRLFCFYDMTLLGWAPYYERKC